MHVCYNNLFKLLIDRGWNKTEFAHEVGISSNTLAKLEVLVRICQRLDCTLSDVVQLVPPEPPTPIRDGLERVKQLASRRTEGGSADRHE